MTRRWGRREPWYLRVRPAVLVVLGCVGLWMLLVTFHVWLGALFLAAGCFALGLVGLFRE